jgi:hypothetical protein
VFICLFVCLFDLRGSWSSWSGSGASASSTSRQLFSFPTESRHLQSRVSAGRQRFHAGFATEVKDLRRGGMGWRWSRSSMCDKVDYLG